LGDWQVEVVLRGGRRLLLTPGFHIQTLVRAGVTILLQSFCFELTTRATIRRIVILVKARKSRAITISRTGERQ
jgi:hypothetical protein